MPDEKKRVCKCCLYVNKCPIGGKWVRGRGVKEGTVNKVQLTTSKGPGRMGIHHHEQWTTFRSKGFSFPNMEHASSVLL